MKSIKNSKEENVKLLSYIEDIIQNKFKKMARSEKLICGISCIVASYDSVSNTATIYFPSDLVNPSAVSYSNESGSSLVVGQKVEVFYYYGNKDQGWITKQY